MSMITLTKIYVSLLTSHFKIHFAQVVVAHHVVKKSTGSFEKTGSGPSLGSLSQ